MGAGQPHDTYDRTANLTDGGASVHLGNRLTVIDSSSFTCDAEENLTRKGPPGVEDRTPVGNIGAV